MTEPLSDQELREQQRRIVRGALLATVFCAVVMIAGYLSLPEFFILSSTVAERLAFAIQADLFIFLWVIIAVRMVSRVRFKSAADNRGAAFGPPSPKLAIPAAFLQNTLEQAFIAVGAHLTLASLTGGAFLSLIDSAVILFTIGRISFFVRYEKGSGARSFGMVVTALPNLVLYGLCIWLILT